MILCVFIMTDAKGNKYRYERYAQSPSIMDTMHAEDSAIQGFIKTFQCDPTKVERLGMTN